jgi:threonyl-tRNA synthetase
MSQTEYRKRGYNEVITPNMYNTKLWERSGHLQNYEVSYAFFIYTYL